MYTVILPDRLAERIRLLGVDVEIYVIDSVLKRLKLTPREELEVHAELAKKYLEDAVNLLPGDPARASEKLYKAVEEAVKALSAQLGLDEHRGRWTLSRLEKAVAKLSDRLGEWVRYAWDAANYLHTWGFQGAKLDGEDVARRLPDIERLVKKVEEVLS